MLVRDSCEDRPSSWFAEVVVRLNCCSKYFPRKAAKPATTAISMQAARMMQVNTGLDRRCLVTLGITGCQRKKQHIQHVISQYRHEALVAFMPLLTLKYNCLVNHTNNKPSMKTSILSSLCNCRFSLSTSKCSSQVHFSATVIS